MNLPARLTSRPPVIAAIALGGNVGHVVETFEQAILALGKSHVAQLVARSRNFRTRAIGNQAGADYFNAAILLETTCSPRALLKLLQSTENQFGRIRSWHWGPRTLDLDLLSYHTDIIDEADTPHTLFVPHPACWFRRFVLDPWVEIAPDWQHPILNESVRQMRERLLERPLPIRVAGRREHVQFLQHRLSNTFNAAQIRFSETTDASVIFRMETGISSEKMPLSGRIIDLSPISPDPDQDHRKPLREPTDTEVQRVILTLQAMLDTPAPLTEIP